MNKLIESINYASDSYWGDPERFKFNAKIDSYTNNVELTQGSNRNVKTNFGLKIQGYLISDNINKELAKKPQKFFSKAVVSFGTELEVLPSQNKKSKTRKAIREATGEQNIRQAGRGVGYQEIGQQSSKITGLPFTSSSVNQNGVGLVQDVSGITYGSGYGDIYGRVNASVDTCQLLQKKIDGSTHSESPGFLNGTVTLRGMIIYFT